MPRATILVIEDDAPIRRGLVDALSFEGYRTFETADGRTGRDAALGTACDLVLLDLMLPKLPGLDVLREVRKARPRLPVIILTARGEETDRVEGLKLGADDYVVKPFSVRELTARVEAVLRRSAERPGDLKRVPFAGGMADLERFELCFDDGECITLSQREGDLLRYLAVNPGRAVGRDELLPTVWGLNPEGLATRTVDMQVARLREKLKDDTTAPTIIRTVRGKGYTFITAS